MQMQTLCVNKAYSKERFANFKVYSYVQVKMRRKDQMCRFQIQ